MRSDMDHSRPRYALERLEARRLLSTAVAHAGTPDPTFGPDGIRAIDLPGGGGSLSVVAQQGAKLLASGYVDNNNVISRLNLDGSVDPSFGVGGYLPLSSEFDKLAI